MDLYPAHADYKPLHSALDASVNFIAKTGDGGAFEARFVQREPRYFIVYLSSHSGCDKACRFCHLTQTAQTTMLPAQHTDYTFQAMQVLRHYDETHATPAEFVNFNFMARGEPFENDRVLEAWESLRNGLGALAKSRNLRPQFNLSTIMPTSLRGRDLVDILGREPQGTSIYYSLYSLNPRFRRRWLPKAMPPLPALDMLAEWQAKTDGDVVLHWSFIEGENDDQETVEEIIAAVKARGLKTRFNLVRYNPYSPAQGKEPNDTVLAELFNRLAFHLDSGKTEMIPRIVMSRMVPRVGMDVKASCGMFVEV